MLVKLTILSRIYKNIIDSCVVVVSARRGDTNLLMPSINRSERDVFPRCSADLIIVMTCCEIKECPHDACRT